MRSLDRAALGLALAACFLSAHAEDAAIPIHPALHDRFYFGVGAFVPKTTTTAQFDSARLGVGTSIDFEQALGMQTQKTVPEFFARFRMTDRWRIEASYFALNRSGNRSLDNSIQWGDQVFPANAQVSSKFNFSDTRVSAGYSFFKTADKELGVGLGFHVASYQASLNTNSFGSQASDVLAPLPVLSLYGLFALTSEWAVGGRLDRFSLTYNNVSGNISSMGLDLMYQPFRNVGFGLGYRSLFITVTDSSSDATKKFNQTFQGPLLFMNASF
jgi:hypothetical protein